MNYFLEVLKKYAVFEGRARRAEYWYYFLFSTIISYGLLYIGIQIGIPLLSSIFSFGTLLPAIGVAIRRMHDTNHSGWFILVPIYNLILLCTDGDRGPNQYGDDPKDPSSTSLFGEKLDDHL